MASYRAIFEHDREKGGYVATFPDLPFGVTQGDNEEEAVSMARDCIITVLQELMSERKPLPKPGKSRPRGVRLIVLPALASAKVELYNAWLASGMKKSEFAAKLGIPKTIVDRLFDLGHSSRLDQIEAAFRVLGKHLTVHVQNAA